MDNGASLHTATHTTLRTVQPKPVLVDDNENSTRQLVTRGEPMLEDPTVVTVLGKLA